MRALRLEWRDAPPPGMIDGAALRPGALCRLEDRELYRVRLRCGSEDIELGDVLRAEDASGRRPGVLRVPGSPRLLRLGAGLDEGELEVDGPAGPLAGAGMRGGAMRVAGDVGPLAAAGMTGGLLTVEGSAGEFLGGPLPGARRGMAGGEVVVRGDAGPRAGYRLRRGLIAVGGTAGPGAGESLLAGTVVVARGDLPLPGRGMRRGTVIALDACPEAPAGFAPAGPVRPIIWRVLVRRLLDLGVPLDDDLATLDRAAFLAWSGDRTSLGRGELLFRTERASAGR